MESACKKAELENEITPSQCTWVAFWREGEVYKLWERVGHNSWMLYGIIAPVLLLIVFLWYKDRSNERENQRNDKLLSIMENFSNNIQSSSRQPLMLEGGAKKKKKHKGPIIELLPTGYTSD